MQSSAPRMSLLISGSKATPVESGTSQKLRMKETAILCAEPAINLQNSGP